jgi:transcriptional regulator with XRE-family HTH domain
MKLDLGSVIKSQRKKHHYKQQLVADYLFVSRPTYVRYERNQVEMPLSKLFELALLYNMQVTALVKLIGEQTRNNALNEAIERQQLLSLLAEAEVAVS